MKKLKHITRSVCCYCVATCFAAAPTLLVSCGEDDLDGTSIFQNEMTEQQQQAESAFDKWLGQQFVKQYNIEFKYRLEDTETDYKYNLIPADQTKVNRMAHAILYGWLQAYDEVAGHDFTCRYCPKIIQLIGSYPYDSKGSVKLGTAEDGIKVTFYNINEFKTTADVLTSHFQIMHHEFTHILTHNKDYDTAFRAISDTAYVSGGWTKVTVEEDALKKGFINNYAMKEYNEDFAETMSFYLIYTPTEWSAKLTKAGTDGAAIINKKLDIVRSYMWTAWGIDIDVMRTVLQRRLNEIVSGTVDMESLK
jgi:substrate import-associated zinc metallohydrolase lipoprotein